MSLGVKILLFAALTLSIAVPNIAFFSGKHTKKRFKRSFAANAASFFGTVVTSSLIAFANASPALAASASDASGATGMGYLAAALVTGMSCIGGGVAVASAASAALGALSEDGSVFGKAMIFVAMAEGIALYGLIISFMILGQL